MARESFSDENVAAYLAENFVSIKVDREEHPDVDAAYMAQASAFSGQLGWPLTVFTTPEGKAFYAGTYYPPEPVRGHPSFMQVLEAVTDAWRNRREQVLSNGAAVVGAVRSGTIPPAGGELPTAEDLQAAAERLAAQEDALYGGFGSAPKFPVAPALLFLQALGGEHEGLAARTLERMAASPLRDPVEGGFFRYATMRDWSEPHYERMLYDNALLLQAYTSAWVADESRHWAARTAAGIAGFLIGVMQRPSGGYASAQDSESIIDGERSEGGYYARDALGRSTLTPPALDEKVLTGWNGLAIEAMARAGRTFGQPAWVESAQRAADYLLATHVADERMLVRASIAPRDGDGTPRRSDATATLEDYGMLAGGLIELSLVAADAGYADEARRLIDATLVAGEASRSIRIGASDDSGDENEPSAPEVVFAVPGGGDPVLVAHNLVLTSDPSEGAYPSGLSATATAAYRLFLLTADRRYAEAARRAVAPLGSVAVDSPVAYGAMLTLATVMGRDPSQLVLVTPDEAPGPGVLAEGIRSSGADVIAVVTESEGRAFAAAGFELFQGRTTVDAQAALYQCTAFVCRLPVTGDAARAALTDAR